MLHFKTLNGETIREPELLRASQVDLYAERNIDAERNIHPE